MIQRRKGFSQLYIPDQIDSDKEGAGPAVRDQGQVDIVFEMPMIRARSLNISLIPSMIIAFF